MDVKALPLVGVDVFVSLRGTILIILSGRWLWPRAAQFASTSLRPDSYIKLVLH